MADRRVRFLAGRIRDDLAVGLDGGEVVADLIDAVVLAGVFEEVLLPPPRLQPAQQVSRARVLVAGQDLQDRAAVLEEGELAGLPVGAPG
jgi:hypothetical protein